MKKNISKLVLATIIGAGAFTLQGCTDEEVALGAGVVAGVVIGSSLDNDHHHHHYRPNPRRYPRRHHWANTTHTFDSTSIDVAQKYNINLTASTKIVAALESAEAGEVTALTTIGLTRKDLASVYNGRMISNDSLKNVSNALEINHSDAKNLIKQIASEVKEKRTLPGASESTYERFW